MLKLSSSSFEEKEVKSILGLSFRHFSTSAPGKYLDLCESSFLFWKKEWEKTFQELQCPRSLWSDDFLYKELGGLFINDRPIGFLLYQFLDLSLQTQQGLSYFHNYPEDLKNKTCEPKDKVMVISYMTLDSEWTKSKTDYPISELLISFAVLRFLQSPAQRLIGYFRNNRGTQNIFYRHGGTPIVKNLNAYNVEVDFAQITRESARLSSLPSCDQVALYFWNQMNLSHKGAHHDDQSRTNQIIYEAINRQLA